MDSGWVAIARAIRDHAIVGFHLHAKPCDPSRGALQPALAWIDLIMECRYESGTVNNNGRPMRLERGQLLGATSWLASRWNWTPMAVRWWLEKLEKHKMINLGVQNDQISVDQIAPQNHNRSDEAKDVNHNRSNNRSRGRFANVITICNYRQYQLSSEDRQQVEQQVEQQANNRLEPESHQVNNRLAYIENARAVNKDNNITKEQESLPPTPLAGGEPKLPFDDEKVEADAKRAARTADTRHRNEERKKLLAQALELFNLAADHWKFSRCESFTDARRDRLAKRLDDIGGLENFRKALRAIGKDDFLAGRKHPRPGEQPFKLNFDRLMQTEGNMGDVLARLVELGSSTDVPRSPNGKEWGWWRGSEQSIRALPAKFWRELIATEKPNGTWPWWQLTGPPGSDDCLVHPDVLDEMGYVEKYKGQLTAGDGL
jgi:hypothetical protein